MQNPLTSNLDALRETRRSELTIKAAHQTLQSFLAWWEADRNRPFDLALLRDADLEQTGCLTENPAASVAAIASTPLSPKSISTEAADAETILASFHPE